jgi:hypothetical protein
MKIPLGHNRSARTVGIAERTPKLLASYEAAQTRLLQISQQDLRMQSAVGKNNGLQLAGK